MSEQRQLPEPEKVKNTVAMLRESNRMLETWTQTLDELIAIVEADIRNSPINVHRRENAKRLAESVKQE
ncbi:MAG: hypothetical protein JGK21_29885 [Microcoleus sp. PH2017_22_RUC_O_B]|uniref:hypothetical protein n=1 Tax=unclassified Microcoleus TaxID=2642155 RepID=UPI001DF73C62|nr:MULTISPECIES: hypothetical protein [unclassified Microcoleus]MCC3532146.1 hypothetical protein [Microcoleus sp. PH2017_21_RUC_O_A]MCC3544461.1 hypothetical protein [Microcoleus sp. PH2017_22_RUC_O_B]